MEIPLYESETGNTSVPIDGPYPNLKQSWILLVYYLGTIVLVSGIFSVLGINSLIFENTLRYGLLLFVAYRNKHKTNDRVFIRYRNRNSLSLILPLIPATLGLGIVVSVIDGLLLFVLPMPEWLEKIFENIVTGNQTADLILFIVLVGPVGEELIMRGVICEGLLRNTTPAKAIVWSSIIFSVFHLNPWQGITAFVFGCFVGWLYWKTRSIIPCILVHVFHNSIVVVKNTFWVDLHSEKASFLSKKDFFSGSELLYLVVGLIAFLIGYYLIKLALIVVPEEPKTRRED